MRKLNTIRVFIPVFLALAMLVGAWGSASAAFIDENHNFQGRMGVFVPAGLDSETFHVNKLSQKEIGFAPVKFRAPLIHLEQHVGSTTLSFPSSITYVVFDINRADLRDWEDGTLGIFYLDLDSHTWQPCNAFLVDENQQASGEQSQTQDQAQSQTEGQTQDETQAQTGSERTSARLACVAPQMTVFGYGTLRSGEQVQMPVQTSTAPEEATTP